MDVQRGDDAQAQGSQQLQVPIGAAVSCADGLGGISTHLLVNPVAQKVTHLVVREITPQHPEYVVPMESVKAASSDIILLKCTRDELRHMKRFVQTEYTEVPMPLVAYTGGLPTNSYLVWPYVVPEVTMRVPVEREQVPQDELVVHRGTRVEATDGTVGHVDELLVDPDTGNVTHLVMGEGNLLGQKDVTIPVSAIDTASDDTVALKLSKQEIDALPSIRVRRPPIPLP